MNAGAPGDAAARVHFLGIGAQKAATTWLFERLAAHPRVRFPGGKELHFWDRRGDRPARAWLDAFPPAEPGVRQGEITPSYALLDDAAVREIRALAPHLRIVYCLRAPMQRAWSSALMALERAEMRCDEASDAWFADHFRSRGSLGRGDYETTLRRWRGVFGDDAVLVLFHDDLVADPRAWLRRAALHLGVDPEPFESADASLLRRRAFAGPDLPVRPSLRPLLESLYAERIASLERYLGRDLSAWRGFGEEVA